MENLLLEKTISTPLIRFDAGSGFLLIQGESYPENVSKFYTPVLDWIKGYLESDVEEIVLQFDIPYFNSSSSKVLLMLLDMLEQGVQNGKRISVKWMCAKGNELAIECGEEFMEDLEHVSFEIVLYD